MASTVDGPRVDIQPRVRDVSRMTNKTAREGSATDNDDDDGYYLHGAFTLRSRLRRIVWLQDGSRGGFFHV